MNYKIELATVGDIEQIHKLIVDRCNWFIKNNIKQWEIDYYPNKYNNDYFEEQIKINKLYVARLNNKVVGAMLLKKTDSQYWENNDNAFYIHHLVTSDNCKGLGKILLDYAVDEAKKENKDYLRLDCWKANIKLNKYYEQNGFTYIGSGNNEAYYYNLWEMKIEK